MEAFIDRGVHRIFVDHKIGIQTFWSYEGDKLLMAQLIAHSPEDSRSKGTLILGTYEANGDFQISHNLECVGIFPLIGEQNRHLVWSLLENKWLDSIRGGATLYMTPAQHDSHGTPPLMGLMDRYKRYFEYDHEMGKWIVKDPTLLSSVMQKADPERQALLDFCQDLAYYNAISDLDGGDLAKPIRVEDFMTHQLSFFSNGKSDLVLRKAKDHSNLSYRLMQFDWDRRIEVPQHPGKVFHWVNLFRYTPDTKVTDYIPCLIQDLPTTSSSWPSDRYSWGRCRQFADLWDRVISANIEGQRAQADSLRTPLVLKDGSLEWIDVEELDVDDQHAVNGREFTVEDERSSSQSFDFNRQWA